MVDVQFDAKVASVGKRRLEFDFTPTANPDCWARGEAYCGDNVRHWCHGFHALRPGMPASPVCSAACYLLALSNMCERLNIT